LGYVLERFVIVSANATSRVNHACLKPHTTAGSIAGVMGSYSTTDEESSEDLSSGAVWRPQARHWFALLLLCAISCRSFAAP
jgi:hypothetical protein